jgi:hypothetical protein
VCSKGEAGQFTVVAGMGYRIWFAIGAFVIFVVMLVMAAKGKKKRAGQRI